MQCRLAFATVRDIALINVQSEIQSQGRPRTISYDRFVRFSCAFLHLRYFKWYIGVCPGFSEGEKKREKGLERKKHNQDESIEAFSPGSSPSLPLSLFSLYLYVNYN